MIINKIQIYIIHNYNFLYRVIRRKKNCIFAAKKMNENLKKRMAQP